MMTCDTMVRLVQEMYEVADKTSEAEGGGHVWHRVLVPMR